MCAKNENATAKMPPLPGRDEWSSGIAILSRSRPMGNHHTPGRFRFQIWHSLAIVWLRRKTGVERPSILIGRENDHGWQKPRDRICPGNAQTTTDEKWRQLQPVHFGIHRNPMRQVPTCGGPFLPLSNWRFEIAFQSPIATAESGTKTEMLLRK